MTPPQHPMTPEEQNELLSELTVMLTQALPEGWQHLVIDYRQVGRHIDIGVGVRTAEDNSLQLWDPPQETWRYLQALRHGMYVQDQGTWFSARFTLDHPDTFRIQYNYLDMPHWGQAPASEFTVELERYPRTEENMPVWFLMHL